ncbi:hypothetical protein OUZ56_000699 [Daphnia magna]|uniref:Uncharacterized protein n=1 Tax=Daphnia magna TaxID=35525 RepID=A0ABR0A182_9CRUS|nr:hypothetical protein OUZ56_000699 [Daphnia magna]
MKCEPSLHVADILPSLFDGQSTRSKPIDRNKKRKSKTTWSSLYPFLEIMGFLHKWLYVSLSLRLAIPYKCLLCNCHPPLPEMAFSGRRAVFPPLDKSLVTGDHTASTCNPHSLMKTGRRTERSSHSNLKMSADIPPGTEYTQCLILKNLNDAALSNFILIASAIFHLLEYTTPS